MTSPPLKKNFIFKKVNFQAYQSLKESLFKGPGASYNDLNQVFGTGPQQHLYGGR